MRNGEATAIICRARSRRGFGIFSMGNMTTMLEPAVGTRWNPTYHFSPNLLSIY